MIQADGGTRTAAITGGCLALREALKWLLARERIRKMPAFNYIAAISAGIYRGRVVLDLDYAEDSLAGTDTNIVMNEHGQFIEIQGTAEEESFSYPHLQEMLELAQVGIQNLIALQKEA